MKNEFLKQLNDEGLEFILNFFNRILETGVIPDDWSIGTILPLYKNKGTPTDPGNYRGITLLSCLGKLFTAILNGRINKFMNENGLLGHEQAGFRAGHSTMDHAFLLHHIIDFYRQSGKQVFCAFVDYSKAFDLVNRAALWCKLLKEGISGKILTVIQNMYHGAKSCVRANTGELSGFFKCTAGVRQGENLSPVLFAIYLNDFQAFIADHSAGLKDFENAMEEFSTFAKLCVLLYADDTVLMAETADELQAALDALALYCKQWDLTVNLTKTNVVIFSKGRITTKMPKSGKFTFEGNEVKVLDDYTYLGVIFNYNGSFEKAIVNQKAVALKAMHALLSKVRILRLDVDTSLELFQRCVMPILLYGSEVRAYDSRHISELDVLYKGFIKQILHVYGATPTCMIFGETGQPDLNSLITARHVGFWAKLAYDGTPRLSKLILPVLTGLQGKHTPIHRADKESCYDFKWLSHLRQSLNGLGLGYLFDQPMADPKNIALVVKRRINDVRTQVWQGEIREHPECVNYRMFKNEWGLSPYLSLLSLEQRTILTKFRTRNHYLPVCPNSHFKRKTEDSASKIVKDSHCPLCTINEIGDEYHYIFKCPAFAADRKKLIDVRYTNRHNALKFQELFESNDIEVLGKLAKFTHIIMSTFASDKPWSPLRVKASCTLRSGRVTKRPLKLNDFFV